MGGDASMKQIRHLLDRLKASAVDFWHYLNGSGPYAPRERNPQTMETTLQPALMSLRHDPGKPIVSRATLALIGVALALAVTVATLGYIASRPAPVHVCALYGRDCKATPTHPVAPTDTPQASATPKGTVK